MYNNLNLTGKIFFFLFLSTIMFSYCTPPAEKFVGIQLWSVKDDMKADPEGTIKKLGEMGYKFVETASYGDGKMYGIEPVAFKNLVEANGMKFLAAHCGQSVPRDEESWNTTMAWWDQCIAAHKEAGCEYIIQPYMDAVGYDSLAGLDMYINYFNAVGQKCKDAGIKFGYHNHNKEFSELEGVIIYDHMMENLNPELVFMELDIYWINKGGKNPVDYFEKYPGRFLFYHIKEETELGEGIIDFKPVFENTATSGMQYYVVEVERYNFEPLVSVQKSLEFIKNAEFIKQ